VWESPGPKAIGGYRQPEGYYGIDINPDVISAGYEHELDERLRSGLPLFDLRVTDRFDAAFGVRFDAAMPSPCSLISIEPRPPLACSESQR
jgi:hypothetical protein